MSLSTWNGYGLSPEDQTNRATAQQFTLPVIVRKEKTVPTSYLHAVGALADALTQLFGREENYKSADWEEPLRAWLAGSFRKVVRHARGAKWEALKNHPHIHGRSGTAEVILLTPHLNGEPPTHVKQLQVAGLTLDGSTVTYAEAATRFRGEPLNIAVNTELDMSHGKQFAQIGHGIQLAIQHGLVDDSWVENIRPIMLRPWDDKPAEAVTVVDAGFTEIAPGSETVKAWV